MNQLVNWTLTMSQAKAIRDSFKAGINAIQDMLDDPDMKRAPEELIEPFVKDMLKYKEWKKSLVSAINASK